MALRATIRERGSLKAVLFVSTLGVWALITVLLAAFIDLPLASIIPLLVLMGGFEAVHALHVGAERIGRYLHVHYEAHVPGGLWESAVGAFGTGHTPSTRPADGIFSWLFIAAIAAGPLMAGLRATAPELGTLAVIHLLAIARVVLAKRAAGRQRAEDQQRFEALLTR